MCSVSLDSTQLESVFVFTTGDCSFCVCIICVVDSSLWVRFFLTMCPEDAYLKTKISLIATRRYKVLLSFSCCTLSVQSLGDCGTLEIAHLHTKQVFFKRCHVCIAEHGQRQASEITYGRWCRHIQIEMLILTAPLTS